MARAVVTRDSSSIEDECDSSSMESAIHDDLVDCSVQEGCIDRKHRMKARVSHADSACDRMLLGYADVEGSIWIGLAERFKPVGPSMAAVMATTSDRSSPMETRVSAKA